MFSLPGLRSGRSPAATRRALRVVVGASAIVSLGLTACGGDKGGNVLVRPSTVSTIRVSPTSVPVDVGATYQLGASALDAAGAAVAGKTFTWLSLSPGIASVAAAGAVTGVAAGTATIQATADGVTGTATVVVSLPPAQRCDATTPITVGATVTGTLFSTDCRLNDGSYADKYVLTLAGSTQIRISMTGSVDAFLILQDAVTSAIIEVNDDGNGDTGSRIERVVPAGRYVILANTFDANDFGTYQLTVSPGSAACLDATPIGTNVAVTGTLAATACVLPDSSYADRYTLTVPSATIMTMTMASAAFDSYLFVEQNDGTSIQRDDNGGGGRDARIATTLAKGTYFVYANSSSARENGAYTLTLSSQLDPCGVNRTVTVGSTTTDTLTSSACRLADGSYIKRFGFSVTTSTPVRIDLTSTQFDPYVFVQLAGAAAKVAEDDDSGPGLNAEVLQVLAPGEYVITVTSATAGESGLFELAIAGAVQGTVGVTMTPATVALQPGQTQQLTAAITGSTNTNVLFASSTPTIATVSSTGMVRAITAGAANIVATSAADPSKTAVSAITVAAGTGVNLDVPVVYLTQSVQTLDGRIPLVQDRAAIARVFVRGSASGLGTAAVRVRFFNGAALLGAVTGTATVATVTDEGCCSADISVPAAFVRDGVTMIADVDPNDAVAESNESDNSWPLTGASKPIRVVTVPTVNIQLVPIKHRSNSQVSAPTTQFTAHLQRMYPLGLVNVTVHGEYVTDTPPLTDGSSWLSMLSQMEVLRTLEGSSAYYFGVLNQSVAAGIIGIAGVGGFTGVGVGGPDSTAQETLAHEFGHSFGRQHSPTPSRCGTPSGVDANYPRSDGSIGIYGYNVPAATIFTPDRFDVMGYCDNTWASEYTYAGVLRYLRSGALPPARVTSAEVPVLLISGSFLGSTISVDPVFSTVSAPTAQRSAGRFIAEGLSSDGRVLFRHRFDGVDIRDVDATARAFVVAVPYDASANGAVARITVTDASGGGSPALRARSGVYSGVPGGVSLRVDADPQLIVRASGAGRFELTWNVSRYPSIVVRNASSRRVLGAGRRGAITIDAASLADLEVLLSDGVSSSARNLSMTMAP
ncbi:MAG: Ig-like domain-containing protein [Gemmatimonadaceae bacterium]|nr:Ig-like domain-containing protein [Gemmatimonadaceae bacterium]